MCPKVSLNKAIVLSSALFSAKLKLFSAKVWKCQHFSAQRRNYQEATARNLFIRDNFDSTSHTALFLREPKRFGRYFSFFFLFFWEGGGAFPILSHPDFSATGKIKFVLGICQWLVQRVLAFTYGFISCIVSLRPSIY